MADTTNNIPVYVRGVAKPVTIVGIDGEPPIYDETQVWRRWALHDIYLGQEGRNKWIPKVNDFVEDIDTLVTYKVVSIDQTTYVPELVQVNKSIHTAEMSVEEGRFFAGGTLATPCSRQIFYDNSVARPTLKIPSQFTINGTTPHHAIAYRGTVAGRGGRPISIRYDQNFNIIGNEIPLQLINQQDPNNRTQWYIPDFYCSEELEEGEMVLIVLYDDRGGPVSRTNWIVEYSQLLRDVSDADKFISAISLESFFIDSSDESNLIIPEQILKNSINLMGKVEYTDGTSVKYPIDGNRFELLYMEKAMESVVSTVGKLVLVYHLKDNEKAVGVINNNNRFMVTRSYDYTISEREGAYSVKLFPVPVWVNDSIGYRLDWYLFTLDRNQWFNVTNDVYITQSSPTKRLNGKLFGAVQQLDVAIDLGNINNTFREFIHPQTVDIRLMRPATDMTGDRYYIGYSAYQNPPYGENLSCVVRQVTGSRYTINISNGFTVLEDWLEQIYYNTHPMYRTSREPNAPAPNMFKILVKGRQYEFPIRKWNTDLSIPETILPKDTVCVVFMTRYDTNDVFYGISPLPVVIS